MRTDEKFTDTLVRYMDACLPIIYVDTLEDDKAERLLQGVAKSQGRKLLEWDKVHGLLDMGTKIIKPKSLLNTLHDMYQKNLQEGPEVKTLERKMLVVRDIGPELQTGDPGTAPQAAALVSYLKYFAQQINLGFYGEDGIDEFTIILVGPYSPLPKELSSYVTVLALDPMEVDDIQDMIVKYVKDQEIQDDIDPDLAKKLATNLHGLTETEIVNILQLASSDDGVIDENDIPLILEQKQQIIRKSGVLEIIPRREKMSDIGGLEVLKAWLERKAKIFKDLERAKEFGVAVPKGVFVVGMPGCGKSLTAKAVAAQFDMPLLKLDMGRLMGKYVGESEANMRRAIQLTEASSPCILWIDEVEKAFAGAKTGGSELTVRLFGSFLTWMQEKKSPVFVVATANRTDVLPPELLRKGRFDEIFFVNLPNEAERKQIFKIHISKKHQEDLKSIDLNMLVRRTANGFCEADIESVVHDAIEQVFLEGRPRLETQDLLNAIEKTHPIGETMHAALEEMESKRDENKFTSASA